LTVNTKPFSILSGDRQTPERPRQYRRSPARQAAADPRRGSSGVPRGRVRARLHGPHRATIYNHFHDKKELFLACIREHTREKREALAALLGSPSGDVEQHLQRFGETLLRFLTTRDALALRRIILADTQRFPELGQALYDEGPLAMRHRLAAYLQEQADAGALRLEDAKLAAHQFILLCQGDLYLPVEYGILRDPPEERVRDTVRGAVRTFLRAYGPR